MKTIKREIRVIGIDDAPFDKFKDKSVLAVGTIFRGGYCMDGLLSTHITVDGNDTTEKLAKMINSSKHKKQLQVIMLDGIALGGFNIVDIRELAKQTGLGVITVMRERPDIEMMKKALKNVPDNTSKLDLIEKAGEIKKIDFSNDKCFVQFANIDEKSVKSIIETTCTRSLVPEPLRLAHIIASGIVHGESRGRA